MPAAPDGARPPSAAADPGAEGDQQAERDHHPDGRAQVPHQGVVHRLGGRLVHPGRELVQVDRPEHAQPDAQQQGPTGHGQCGRDHRPAPPRRQQHPAERAGHRQHRHPEAGQVQYPQAGAGLGDGVGLHQRVRGVDLRDLRGQREPVVDQRGLHPGDQRGEVEHHGVVLDLHGAAALPGEHLVDRGVGVPVDARPDGGEGVALHHPLDLGVDEAGDSAGEGLADAVQQGAELRAVVGGDVGEQGVDGELLHDLVGHPVGDGGLDRRVLGQWGHRGDVPVGVADLRLRPDRDGAQRGQDEGQQDQQSGEEGACPVALRVFGRTVRQPPGELRLLGLDGAQPGP